MEPSEPLDDASRSDAPTAPRSLWMKLLLGLVPLVLVVLLVEGSLRVAGIGRPPPELVSSSERIDLELTSPDGRTSAYSEGLYTGTKIVINSEGYRDWLYFEDEREGALRIAGLGDSYTFGDGMEPEETWLRRLGERVEAGLRGSEGRTVRTLNFGRRGSNTTEQLAALERDVLRYSPDVIVHGFTLFNDAETKQYRKSDMKKRVAREQEASWTLVQWIKAHSYAAQYAIKTLRRGRNQQAMRDHIAKQYADDAPGFIACREALGGIAAACRESGVPLVFVLFPSHHRDPVLNDFTTTEFAEAHAKVIAALADYPEVAIVDMADHLAEFQGEVIWIPGNGHPDARYCEKVAEVVAPEVLRLLAK